MNQITETTVAAETAAVAETVSNKKAKRSKKLAAEAVVEQVEAVVEAVTAEQVETATEVTAEQVEVVEEVQEIVMSLNSARTLPSTTKSAAVRIMIAEAKVNGEEQPAVVARVVTELGFKTALAKVYVRNNWAKVNAELRTVA